MRIGAVCGGIQNLTDEKPFNADICTRVSDMWVQAHLWRAHIAVTKLDSMCGAEVPGRSLHTTAQACCAHALDGCVEAPTERTASSAAAPGRSAHQPHAASRVCAKLLGMHSLEPSARCVAEDLHEQAQVRRAQSSRNSGSQLNCSLGATLVLRWHLPCNDHVTSSCCNGRLKHCLDGARITTKASIHLQEYGSCHRPVYTKLL